MKKTDKNICLHKTYVTVGRHTINQVNKICSVGSEYNKKNKVGLGEGVACALLDRRPREDDIGVKA